MTNGSQKKRFMPRALRNGLRQHLALGISTQRIWQFPGHGLLRHGKKPLKFVLQSRLFYLQYMDWHFYSTRRLLSTMKILHTLVGYLTVTALPFSPSAFASPLEGIHYDGDYSAWQNYNNSALMNHVFGNILETCTF